MNTLNVFFKMWSCGKCLSALIALVGQRLLLALGHHGLLLLNSRVGRRSLLDKLVISRRVVHHVNCQTPQTRVFFSANLAADRLTSFPLGVLSFTLANVREMIILVTEEIHFASGAELFFHVGKLMHVGLVLVQAGCVGKFSFAAFMEALDKLHLAIMSLICGPSAEFLEITKLIIENIGRHERLTWRQKKHSKIRLA